MIELESDLSVRLGALADPRDDQSWAEVIARARAARRHRRRVPIAIAAVLASAVVIASPATGVGGKIVRLFDRAEPAPQRVEASFARLNQGIPPELGPGVRAAQAIRVLTASAGPDGRVVLWLAPLEVGGFCTFLDTGGDGAGGACSVLADDRLSADVQLAGRFSPDGEVLSGPVLLDGYTGNPDADSLVLRFEDGDAATIPLVWVSAPVDTGFFVYAVPAPHWRDGHLPTTLTLLAADGDELDTREIHGITTKGSLTP